MTTTTGVGPCRDGASLRRAFSLLELLTVIGVIAIIVAIVVPALGYARDAAKKTETTSVANQVAQACLTFQQSEGRLPGYFSARTMATAENEARGFTQMQNAMLDLMGGIVQAPGAPAADEIQVGPTATDLVKVKPSLIGANTGGNKTYFTPSAKFFKPLDLSVLGTGRQPGGYTWASNPTLAQSSYGEMIDAYGNPMVLWSIDDSVRGEVVAPTIATNTFAQLRSPTGPAQPAARFYWNSNAAVFTDAMFSFTSGVKQDRSSNLNDNAGQSLLGARLTDDLRRTNLMAILGNPSSPKTLSNGATALAGNAILPSAPRGQIIVHSSGADRTFLSNLDKGGKRARATATNGLYYGLNFRATGSATTDLPGGSVDIASEFDDVLVSGG